MQRKTRAGKQNGAKQAKTRVGTQNGAKVKGSGCGYAKRCKSASNMQIKQSGTQNDAIQEKANAGAQNDTCIANGNARDAMHVKMQCRDLCAI